MPATLVNIRPVVAALKEFFGSSQLSQFMDQTNSLSGLTHRRRLSALGAGGLTRERAPIEVRDVHATHYGRMCPIETPEGPNIGLIGTLASFATVDEFGFIRAPYRRVVKGKVTERDRLPRRLRRRSRPSSRPRRARSAPSPSPRPTRPSTQTGKFDQRAGAGPYARRRRGRRGAAEQVDYMDVNPTQLVSVATALIPFLEHDDANRALMGSNMQRQAVPLLTTEAPYVGTGMEFRAACDTGDVILAEHPGRVAACDANGIVIDLRQGRSRRVRRSPSSRAPTRARSSTRSPSSTWATRSKRAPCWPTARRPTTASSPSARTCSWRS